MNLEAAVAAVRALHHKSLFPVSGGPHRGEHFCPACSADVDDQALAALWPCPTSRALEEGLKVPEVVPGQVQVRGQTARMGLEVMHARFRGDQFRGGPEADDQRTAAEWVADLASHLAGARMAAAQAASGLAVGDKVMVSGSDLATYRAHLMAVAELALSAMESFDRQTQ